MNGIFKSIRILTLLVGLAQPDDPLPLDSTAHRRISDDDPPPRITLRRHNLFGPVKGETLC